jgi:hypothetical protein
MERHKIPWFQTTNQDIMDYNGVSWEIMGWNPKLNGHFEDLNKPAVD